MEKRSTCTPGTQTTSTGDVFTVVCGVDFPGNDMSIIPAVDITQCLESCAGSHPLCIGVAFEATRAHGPNNCYLKSRAGTAVTQTYSMDGAYSAPTPESNACVNEVSPYMANGGVVFELHCGLDYAGGDLVGYHEKSLDTCMEACARYGSGCVGVAYEASLAHGWINCYLKSQLAEPAQQAFVVYGTRVVGTSTSSSLISSTSSMSTPTSSVTTSSSISAQIPLGATPGPASSTQSGGDRNGLKIGLGVGIPLAALLIAIVGIMVLLRRRKRAAEQEAPLPVAGAEKVEGSFWGGGTATVPIGMERNGRVEDRGEFGGADEVVESMMGGGGRVGGREELEGRENQVYEMPGQGQYRG